ncbi:CHASE2 domain-containing protein [Aliivibrio kagoshimensis]|uniref:CHASE2 domain-containing protein n=1 Tax=Aliivibrio kagoshimensis TaxID=2910230 RepID=UPI003D0DEDEF
MSKHKVKLILVSCLQALVISIFILFNPLGLKNTSQEQSEMLYLDTTASSFDAKLESAVVVLIDEYTMEKYDLNYPVDYKNLSRILRSISSHNPNSVFIDVLQNYQHSKELDYWLKHLKKSSEHHPIYLAQDLEFDKQWRLNNKENIRYKLSQNTTLAPVSWRGPSNRYPLMVSHNGQNHKTAALLMYERYCESVNCQLFQSSENYDESMVVRWSNKNSNEQTAFLKVADGCEFQQRSMRQAISRHVTYGFQSKKAIDEHRVKCPPILTLSANDFLAQNSKGNQDLRKVIENRAVFIGYDLLGSSDLVVSPVHNQLPGVFYHAMAFVNLVSMDTEYWRSPNVIGECPVVGDCNFSYYDLIQILLYAVVLGFSLYLKKSYVLYSDENTKKLLTYSVLFLVVTTIVVFSIVVFQDIAGPANWITLTSILIISASMLIKPVVINIHQWALINLKSKNIGKLLILRFKVMVRK